MKCASVRELASDALDGVLEPALAKRFHSHVDACPSCQSFYAELRESLVLLTELPELEPSADFEREVWAKIREEESPVGLRETMQARWQSFLRRIEVGMAPWRMAPMAAVAVALVIVALMPADQEGRARPSTEREVSSRGGGSQLTGSGPATGAGEIAVPASPTEFAVAGDLEPALDEDEVSTEEFEAGMPEAVLRFLESAPELRLPSPEQYRRSNYHYPIRRVEDPMRNDAVLRVNGQAGSIALPVSGTASNMPVLSF